jgi:hypothetical protein
LSIQEGVASRNLPSQFSARPHRIVCTGDPTYAKKIAGMCWAEVLSRLNSWVENSSMSFYASSAGHLAIFPKSGHSDRPAWSWRKRIAPIATGLSLNVVSSLQRRPPTQGHE